MELIKILFPYLAILAISVFVRVQCGNEERFLRHEECFCIPGNRGERVSNYVSPNGEKQDRLIVFLYMDKNKHVNVYIPGKEKQKALPDLTYDDGDIIDQLDTKNVNQLFTTYSEVIPQNAEVPNKIPDDLPYNTLNIDDMQVIPDIVAINPETNLNGYIIGNARPSKKKQISSDIDSPISINYINFPEDMSVSSDQNSHKPGNAPHIIQYAPLGSGDIKVSQDKYIKDGKIEAPQSTPEPIYDLPLEDKDLHPDDKILYDDLVTVQGPNAPEIVNDEANGSSANDRKTIMETQSGLNEHRPVIVQIPRKYNNVKIVPVPQATITPKPSSDNPIYVYTLPLKQQVFNQAINIPNNNNPKFKKWFLEQIRLLQIRRPSIRHVINVRKLENVLVQTLYRNGLIISESGDLRDANGNIIKITNLRLRPFILGDPVHNEKVVANECQTANNVQYFEAVLVTLIHPPKILGMIPLGKINKPCCNKYPCYKPKQNPQSIVNYNIKPQKEAIKLDRGLVMSSRPKGNSLLGTFLNSRRMNKDPEVMLPKVEDVMVPKVVTLELPKDEVEALFKGFSEGKTSEKEAPVEDLSIAKENEVEDVEDNEGDDDLGIRIVGGTPATSSGTPVNVRGRRGII